MSNSCMKYGVNRRVWNCIRQTDRQTAGQKNQSKRSDTKQAASSNYETNQQTQQNQ